MKPTEIIFTTILFLFTLQSAYLFAQEIPFVPPVYNYTTSNYNGGNQNWAIAQDKNRIIYVANNRGLLSFDGANWELHTLPNNRGVKSILIETSSHEKGSNNFPNPQRIYVGSFEEFGYFERDATNRLVYHSLKHRVKEYTFQNDEIWTIVKQNNTIYFQSFSSYFSYNEKGVTPHKLSPTPLYLFSLQNQIFAPMIRDGLFQLKEKSFERIVRREQLMDDDVVGMISLKNNYLLVTSINGIYSYNPADKRLQKWKTSVDDQLQSAVINRVVSLSDSLFVMGSINEGLYAINHRGELKWHLNRKNGLNNNTVLGLFKDKASNLWVALDNGVSQIQLNSYVSLFEPTDIQIGMVEDILMSNGKTYVASNQGIYLYDADGKSFKQLPGFNIQTWYLREIDNQIIAGHNKGASFIVNNRQQPIIGSSVGGTDIKKATINNTNVLIESTYSYLSVFLKDESGKWKFSHNVNEGFVDLITHIEIDHTENVWLGHMYKGVYRIRLDNEIRKVVEKEYFETLDSSKTPSPLRVMKLRGRIVLTDKEKFYTYDDIAQEIIPYTLLNTQLPELAGTYRIVPVNDHQFWFIKNSEYVLVEYVLGKYKVKDKVPFSIFNNPPNEGRANIYIDKNGLSYFTLNGGIAKYNFLERGKDEWKDLYLSTVWTYNRADNTNRYLSLTDENVIEFNENTLNFNFAYPDFSKTTFRVECFLENWDTRWIPANNQFSITYANLPADDYLLKARVLDDLGEEISTISFAFRVKPPWFLSSWAYMVYLFLALLIASMLTFTYIKYAIRRNNKFFLAQEKERMAQLNKQQKEIATLKSERLQADLSHKSKELANATMLIINHEDFLNDLKKEIQKNTLSGKIQKKQGELLVDKINKNISDEDEWALFQENFDLIHQNFFRNLKAAYPELTPVDLRMCALLRLNYSSKEIAKIQNLSIRGVEAARYRLRKKIDIGENEDLVSFMINFL